MFPAATTFLSGVGDLVSAQRKPIFGQALDKLHGLPGNFKLFIGGDH